ncbi:hypothetical protein EGR_10273 [Echinococcus granulosus]|uniref:Uncharacterized protein n=1 Tax=Echinococcus granulosus TaxID=6210 RepID=W6U193_ECHGR|nr:hypothetical protein EGR_10273 [Echinococcus granulosus]EUB54880.1 hypothetical protein EGR_10273 [Echinococcus granulosus]
MSDYYHPYFMLSPITFKKLFAFVFGNKETETYPWIPFVCFKIVECALELGGTLKTPENVPVFTLNKDINPEEMLVNQISRVLNNWVQQCKMALHLTNKDLLSENKNKQISIPLNVRLLSPILYAFTYNFQKAFCFCFVKRL